MLRVTCFAAGTISPVSLPETTTLVRALHRAATARVKDEKLWSRLSGRAESLLIHMDKSELIKILCSFGHARFQSQKLLRELTPLLSRQIPNLTAEEIAVCLNALRAVEHRDIDLIQLLLNQAIVADLNSKHTALIMNAAAFFRVNDSNIWRSLSSLHIVEDLSAQGFALVIAALAKVDRRDKALLNALTSKLPEKLNFMKPPELAVTVSGLCRLDWPLPEIVAEVVKVNVAKFDTQAAVSVLHGLFCLAKVDDSELRQLLLERLHGAQLGGEQKKKFEEAVHSSESPSSSNARPKWARSVISVLREMGVQSSVMKEFVFKSSDGEAVVVDFLGPFSYYAESRRLTATAKFRQRVLRRQKFRVLAVPYFEWRELCDVEEKLAYLLTKGRDAMK